jgi:preprotein translocase subunit SecE
MPSWPARHARFHEVTADRLKLIAALLAVFAGIGGYYALGDKALIIRVLVLLGALGVAVALALVTAQGRAAWEFVRESQVELRKVVWPTRKETIQVTLVVVAMVIIMSLFLWVVDWLLAAGVKALIVPGGVK